MKREEAVAVILAAGEGKRMKTAKAKVLHEAAGRPMLDHVLAALDEGGVGRSIVVTGHAEDQVRAHLGDRVACVTQREQLGTAHAVMQAREALAGFDGWVVVCCGDTPLWRGETFARAIERADEHGAAGLVLTMSLDNPGGYGRILRDAGGNIARIVEQKDATKEEILVREVNSGAYVFRARALFEALDHVSNDNAQGEYYLPDVVEILIGQGEKVMAHVVEDPDEALGVNSRADLAAAEAAFQRRINARWMAEGVTLVDPRTIWIDPRTVIGRDAVIHPCTFLRGACEIGGGACIGPLADLTDVKAGEGSAARYCRIENAELAPGEKVEGFDQTKVA